MKINDPRYKLVVGREKSVFHPNMYGGPNVIKEKGVKIKWGKKVKKAKRKENLAQLLCR